MARAIVLSKEDRTDGTGGASGQADGNPVCVAAGVGALHFAAAPVFASMALWTGMAGPDPMNVLCPATHGMPALGGMAVMYGLMSLFHLSPWLKLIARRRGARRR